MSPLPPHCRPPPHRYIRPSMLQHLLRRLVFDVPILNEFAKMPLKVGPWGPPTPPSAPRHPIAAPRHPTASPQLLTNHYERCWKYYCLPSGWPNYGVSSEEELHLTRKLFWGIFESLAHKVWGGQWGWGGDVGRDGGVGVGVWGWEMGTLG